MARLVAQNLQTDDDADNWCSVECDSARRGRFPICAADLSIARRKVHATCDVITRPVVGYSWLYHITSRSKQFIGQLAEYKGSYTPFMFGYIIT